MALVRASADTGTEDELEPTYECRASDLSIVGVMVEARARSGYDRHLVRGWGWCWGQDWY